MSAERQSLPHDTDSLQSMVSELRATVEQQSQFIEQLLEQIRLARHQHLDTRSERFSLDQLPLPLDTDSVHDGNAIAEHNDEAPPSPGTDQAMPGRKARVGRRSLPA